VTNQEASLYFFLSVPFIFIPSSIFLSFPVSIPFYLSISFVSLPSSTYFFHYFLPNILFFLIFLSLFFYMRRIMVLSNSTPVASRTGVGIMLESCFWIVPLRNLARLPILQFQVPRTPSGELTCNRLRHTTFLQVCSPFITLSCHLNMGNVCSWSSDFEVSIHT
jgi:hypothetical protein